MHPKHLPLAGFVLLHEQARNDREEFGDAFAVGALDQILENALSRIEHLERQVKQLRRQPPKAGSPSFPKHEDRASGRAGGAGEAAKEARRVKAILYPRTGNVIPLPTTPKDAA